MRTVAAAIREDLARVYATCEAEAQGAFGSSVLYLEKFVEDARHVEVQVLGDKNGIRVHLGDTVRVHLKNEGQMSHSIDFHASQTAMNHQMVEIKPGETFTYTFQADYAGVWIRCAALIVARGLRR